MRIFNVNVNGVSYEVSVEEVGSVPSAAPKAQAPAVPAAVAAPAAAPAAVKAAAPAPVANGETVSSPMPGTILDIKTAVGSSVKQGDILLILEAMKMENEVVAPQDGKVVQVSVTKGQSVNTGDVLVVIA